MPGSPVGGDEVEPHNIHKACTACAACTACTSCRCCKPALAGHLQHWASVLHHCGAHVRNGAAAHRCTTGRGWEQSPAEPPAQAGRARTGQSTLQQSEDRMPSTHATQPRSPCLPPPLAQTQGIPGGAGRAGSRAPSSTRGSCSAAAAPAAAAGPRAGAPGRGPASG